MEGLHMALNDGLAANMFHGFKVGSPGMHISHLFYADDDIILSEWNLNAMENIIRILNIFTLFPGLRLISINLMYMELGFHLMRLDYRVGRPTFSPLVAALLSSNLCSVAYYLSIFKVLETVVKSLKSLRASFFWDSSGDSKKLAWVKWSNILASLNKGGLGVGSLKAFNMSLLLKCKWSLFCNPNDLWVHVVKAIHGDEAGIDIRGCHANGVWASIIGSIFYLHSNGIVPLKSIHFKVGDGSSIRFWKDTWLGDDPLYIRYNKFYHLKKNKDFFIQQRIADGSWFWDWSRQVNVGRTKA
ncbi:hypothetical protein Tco_1349631 [Tanacetum coccineum]